MRTLRWRAEIKLAGAALLNTDETNTSKSIKLQIECSTVAFSHPEGWNSLCGRESLLRVDGWLALADLTQSWQKSSQLQWPTARLLGKNPLLRAREDM